jgi:phage shock protein C
MKKLNRSENNYIGGVCSGLGEYLDIDETLIRLIFAGSIFTPFPIILTYIIFWIIIPKKHEQSN